MESTSFISLFNAWNKTNRCGVIKKKSQCCESFSSLYIKESLKQTKKFANVINDNDDDVVNFGDKKDYLISGGAYPLIIKEVGVVGSITVSGYSNIEDHDIVVASLKEYFFLL